MFNGLRSQLKKILARPVPITKDHEGDSPKIGTWLFNQKRPIFTNYMAQAMMDDPHIQFGLRLIKGPILSSSRFLVQCEDEEIRQFIVKQITRFWTKGAKYALRSMEYGWYGTEIMYGMEDMQLVFDRFRNIDPINTRPWIKDGCLTGIHVTLNNQTSRTAANQNRIYISAPKCFWTVHSRETNRWFGRSRLYGPHIPWYEYNATDGFRDSRNLYFYKCAFDAGILRFPFGSSTMPDGTIVDNRNLAQSFMDQKRNGSGMMLPMSANPEKNWDWQPPTSVDLAQSFKEYGIDLKEEMWEGLGVPGEVAQASGTGAYAGRQIPQEAFYSLLQEIVQDIITDFDEQILKPLLLVNFGEEHSTYEIECFGLLRNLEDDRGNHKEDARQPLGIDEEQGQQTQNPHLSGRGAQLNMSLLCPSSRPSELNTAWSFNHSAA
jgi:hypothetical protein